VGAGAAEPDLPDRYGDEVDLPRPEACGVEVAQHYPASGFAKQVPDVCIAVHQSSRCSAVEFSQPGLEAIAPSQEELAVVAAERLRVGETGSRITDRVPLR
jgi:hypothetical protein